MDSGKIVADNATDLVVEEYLSSIQKESDLPLGERQNREGNGSLRFKSVYIISGRRGITDTICTGEHVTLIAEYEANSQRPLYNVSVSMPFYDQLGQSMFMCWTRMTGQDWNQIPTIGAFRLDIKKFPLMAGKYSINLWCEVSGMLADWVREAVIVNVVEGDYFGSGYLAPPNQGGVLVEHEWQQVAPGIDHAQNSTEKPLVEVLGNG